MLKKKTLPPVAKVSFNTENETNVRPSGASRLENPIRNIRNSSRAISLLSEEQDRKSGLSRKSVNDDSVVTKTSTGIVYNLKEIKGKAISGRERNGLGLVRMSSTDDNDVPSSVYNRGTKTGALKSKQSHTGEKVHSLTGGPKDNRTTFQRMRSRSVDFSDEGPSDEEEDDFKQLSPRAQLLAPLPERSNHKGCRGKRLLRRKTSEDDIQVGGFKTRRAALNICHVTNIHPHLEAEGATADNLESSGIRGDCWEDPGNIMDIYGQVVTDDVHAVGEAGRSSRKKSQMVLLNSPPGDLVCSSPLLFWRCHLRAIIHIYYHDDHECYEVVAVDAKSGSILPHLFLNAAKIFDLNELALSKSQTLEMRLKKRSAVKRQRVRLGAEYILASLDAEYIDSTKTSSRLFIRKFKGIYSSAQLAGVYDILTFHVQLKTVNSTI